MVLMRQNLHELPDLVRFAAEWEMEALFVQHLCHDFGEETLPAHYGPMREFVQSQTLLEDDPVRVEHFFGLARDRRGAGCRSPAAAHSAADPPAGNARPQAVQLAVERRLCQLHRRRDALLHGLHARPGQHGQHVRPRRGAGLEW